MDFTRNRGSIPTTITDHFPETQINGVSVYDRLHNFLRAYAANQINHDNSSAQDLHVQSDSESITTIDLLVGSDELGTSDALGVLGRAAGGPGVRARPATEGLPFPLLSFE